jgi:hypothetical protein
VVSIVAGGADLRGGGLKGGIPSLMASLIILAASSGYIPVPVVFGPVSSCSSYDITYSPTPPLTLIPTFSDEIILAVGVRQLPSPPLLVWLQFLVLPKVLLPMHVVSRKNLSN